MCERASRSACVWQFIIKTHSIGDGLVSLTIYSAASSHSPSIVHSFTVAPCAFDASNGNEINLLRNTSIVIVLLSTKGIINLLRLLISGMIRDGRF
jgi:hypothetical protein